MTRFTIALWRLSVDVRVRLLKGEPALRLNPERFIWRILARKNGLATHSDQ
ncbi:hypothetical protein [Burkholderia gladioli]|uniref:hypothetical protein n=1 Tax=Burkholderia gladioli TaxID=28095 RepID=UPI001F150283|nr:hypothetical protein [Burkholderia gladioli]